ncbi:membrane protein [Nitratireductor aestuarii]|uniref:Membrane protein n=1 Tax=Nitratireductor aestuarii TaxID=1735103 RepID=A0A916RLC4_9HYPH|nr:lytic murein transglycosylase [Nitratireductor aestuarii]GGA59492.1 membrane protein [Nitratireductor aestuarii]
MRRRLRALFVSVVIAASGVLPAAAQSIDKQFQQWLVSDLWPEARARGIDQRVFKKSFAGIKPNLKLPDLVLPGQKEPTGSSGQHQAEFRAPSAYFDSVRGIVAGGRSRASQYAQALAAVEQRFGVPRGIVLAVWGRESGFGGAKIPHNAFEVLGTKAFLATRKAMFREEVLAALEMVQKRGVSPDSMRSSWAGALGQPQFMPSSYLKYAVDFDGDGRADIWNSVPDTLASIANYLRSHGWVPRRDWGFEVRLPAQLSCALEGPDQGRRVADWAAMGVQRISGKPFPQQEMSGEGFLMLPAGRNGPAFLVTPNFYRLKDYNESDLYALFIGHAGDRIMYGDVAFTAPWGKVEGFSRSEVAAMQRALERLGHDVGGSDGLVGFKTRRSIGLWQEKAGMVPTCYPDKGLVAKIR